MAGPIEINVIVGFLVAATIIAVIVVTLDATRKAGSSARTKRQMLESEIMRFKASVTDHHNAQEQIKREIENLNSQIERLQAERSELVKRIKEQPMRTRYTLIPVDGRLHNDEVYAFVVHNMKLAAQAPIEHPAREWAEGRRYLVFGRSQTAANVAMLVRFPEVDGYVVTPEPGSGGAQQNK